jgi:hypothetical protein
MRLGDPHFERIVRQAVEPLMLGSQAVQLVDQCLAAGVVSRPMQLLSIRQIAHQHLRFGALECLKAFPT